MVNWAALNLKLRSSDPGPRVRRPCENELRPRLCSMFLAPARTEFATSASSSIISLRCFEHSPNDNIGNILHRIESLSPGGAFEVRESTTAARCGHYECFGAIGFCSILLNVL